MRAISGLLLGALLLVFVAPCARAEPGRLTRESVAVQRLDCPSSCPHLEVEAYWRIGPTDGFLQTPRGGKPGTTSPRRPALDEIGVTTGTELGLAASTTWKRHEIAFRGDILYLGGEAVLGQDLTSQDDLFPAGTEIRSKSFLGTYRLTYRYRLDLPLGGRERLVVKPGIGITGLQVSYQTSGFMGRDTDRTYTHGGPHLDLGVSWRPSGTSKLKLEAMASQTLGFLLSGGNQLDILEARLRLTYDVGCGWKIFGETGYRRTDWRDDQEVPNHIHVEYGPWFGFGAGYRF